MPLDTGDFVHIRSSGGGGYGNPHQRDPRLLADDIRLGYVSQNAAQTLYSEAGNAGRRALAL
jgi:N-methylhydantoinase B